MPLEQNRRSFLKIPLAAAALAAVGRASAVENAPVPGRAPRGFRVGSREDRYREELLIMGGSFDLKVSARDTGGDLCIYDTRRRQKGGPAFHRHFFQDEWFYVIRGEFLVKVGEDMVRLSPGDSAFAPRMIPHAFAMVSDGEGQMLILFQPAGSMEDYFLQASRVGRDIPKDMEAVQRRLCEAHGMEVVGPPLEII